MGKRGLVIILCLAAIVGSVIFKINQSKKAKESEANANISCYKFNSGTITGYYYNICGKDINIPSQINGENVKVIGHSAFENMQITSVTLPETLVTIESYAFNNNKIEKVVIPASVTSIGPNAFSNNQISQLEIKPTYLDIGEEAFNNNQLPDDQAFIYYQTNGVDKKSIIGYAGANRTNVTIQDGVIEIGSNAFRNCNIENVVLNKKLEVIGEGAFRGNNLKNITIPSSVVFIGEASFDFTLERVTVEGKKSESDFAHYGTQLFSSDIVKYTGNKNESKKEDKE